MVSKIGWTGLGHAAARLAGGAQLLLGALYFVGGLVALFGPRAADAPWALSVGVVAALTALPAIGAYRYTSRTTWALSLLLHALLLASLAWLLSGVDDLVAGHLIAPLVVATCATVNIAKRPASIGPVFD